MKMATLFSRSLKNCSKLWAGVKAQLSTLTSSETDSSLEKSQSHLSKKLLELLNENSRLKEEIRLLKLSLDPHYDV
jgi:hypothetical protein